MIAKKRAVIRRVGNSYGILISKSTLKALGIKESDIKAGRVMLEVAFKPIWIK